MFRELMDQTNRQSDTYMRLYHAGLLPIVGHVGATHATTDIYMEDNSEAARAAMVREFGPDRLCSYWMSGGELAVSYQHPEGIQAIYYYSDPDERLSVISGGKCTITREAVEQVAEQIICALD